METLAAPLELGRWYTPDQLIAPRKARYVEGVSIAAHQLLIADFTKDTSLLGEASHQQLEKLVPEVTNFADRWPNNLVFKSNVAQLKDFLQH